MRRTNPTETLTVEEAAARKHCSVATIWRRAQNGNLKACRSLGRTVFSAADVDALEVPLPRGRARTSAAPTSTTK